MLEISWVELCKSQESAAGGMVRASSASGPGRAEERCRDLDIYVWRSRPTILLTDTPRGMPEMLEVPWVDFCRAQA